MINLNDALLAALRLGDLDLSINALPGVMPDDLQALPLLEDALCLVVRDGHPLLSRPRLRLTDLVDAQWMLPGPDVPRAATWKAAWRRPACRRRASRWR
jgi:DNA-binding transcriptional LysR family regulator